MGKYFGTDGIRGIVNQTLNAELAYKVGRAAATVLAETGKDNSVIVIGKDTRISSDMLESALIAGICSAGADVMPVGVIPTPAVAYITIKTKADMGIVISASHNSYEHNGIKIFNANGFKLADELESRIEYLIDHENEMLLKTHNEIGRVLHDCGHGLDLYIDYLTQAAELEIKGLRVLIDCANGAAAQTASRLFSRFPIEFELLNEHPNGTNINDRCGSTNMDTLKNMVTAGKFDIGFAFDGDADRCLAVDEKGSIIDGDKIMAVCASAMKKTGKLKNNRVVATVMSNLGFHFFMKQEEIHLLCADVGDRNVLELMQMQDCNLGGEQSGHLIFLDDATTGDGQLAAVKLLGIVALSGKKVSELICQIPEYPQVLFNIEVEGGNSAKDSIMKNQKLLEAIIIEESKLSESGRILVRPSGTEALIRVMVEAKHHEIAVSVAQNLINLIKSL